MSELVRPWKRKDLLGLEDLQVEEIRLILDTAETMKEILQRPIRKVPILRGKTVVNLFFEPSTRTSASFDLAAKRLSADTLNLSAKTSSVQKGETLLDTVKNLEAMKLDVLIIRSPSSGAPHFLAKRLSAGVINAGDGSHEHPTQGLLDLLTLRERFSNMAGIRVLIVGDVAHSRVARSGIWGLTKLGARVSVCGPPTLLPLEVECLGVQVYTDLDKALRETQVVYVLRLQMERQARNLIPSLREYARLFGINRERLKRAKRDVIIMHPGPINRGIELDPDVADGPWSVILEQVTNGVAVRMAVLYLLCGGEAVSA
jgi:aspartate carbamoyltransferase catalytic subunit